MKKPKFRIFEPVEENKKLIERMNKEFLDKVEDKISKAIPDMIKQANELRIGNLLLFSNMIEPDRIISIDAWFLRQLVSDHKVKNTELNGYHHPIPLTEEWLLKFGFVSGKFNYLWGYGNFLYDEKLKLWTWYGIQLHDYLIQYVHQLQNIYFALTGQELKINDR